MTKIEELAKDYKFDIDGSDRERQMAYDGFVDGANALMLLPLSERLNEDEKERIRCNYVAARDGYWDECNDMNIAVESVLESIFGADFFKEGE